MLAWLLASGWLVLRHGLDARVTEHGLEVFSKAKGRIATYAWADIRSMAVRFNPPGYYPEIELLSGEVIRLYIASVEDVASACEAHRILVDRTAHF